VVKDPAKALDGVKGTVEQLQQGAGGGLGQVLEGLIKQPAEGGEQEGADESPPDVGKTLKKLFGN
jgi:hypothetical protein